jgi:ATP-dependent DNA helicase RecG
MTPLDLLRQLNELDEHPRIEAKEASEMGRSVLETVCALANEPGLGGGWLLLGVKPDEQAFWRQYEVTGVPNSDKLQSDLASQCATMFNIPIRPHVEVAEIQGKKIIAVFVSELPAPSKPLFFQATGLPKGAYRRIGSADVRCTQEDMAVFYGDHSSNSLDISVLADGDLDELDPEAVAEYRRLKGQTHSGAEELQWSDPELLRALRCADKDTHGILRPTVAGMLLFGKSTGLRRHFPMMRVDYIRVPGKKWIEDPNTRFETLEIRAPLLRLVGRAVNAILDDLPKAFALQPDEIHRKELPLIPTRVLREAVVNAVMHRSYRIHGAVQIIRYSNRLEIRNPGYSLVSEERWGEPGSVTRNPHIAAVLHEVNLAETKGSGIRVMRQLMEETGLTPPTFESDRGKDQFVATMLFHHFLGPDDWKWLQALKVPALIDEEARALVYVRETFTIDNATYRDLNRVDVLNASNHLRRLRDQGLLEQRGKGSAIYYVPTDRFVSSLFPDLVGAPNSVVFSPTPSDLSGNPPALSGNPPALSGNPPGLSGNPQALPPDLPVELAERILSLGQRISQPVLAQLTIDLCRIRPFSADELAVVLGKTRKHILERALTPLMRSGQLQHSIPDQPNHPDQAYTTPTEHA